MIDLEQLEKTVMVGNSPLTILHPTSLHIPAGQSVAIMGPSGSGKSTLLGLLAGLDAPSSGSIRINGAELTRMNEDALARFRGTTIGFVFQSFQLIPTLTAVENVAVPLEIQGQRGAVARAAELLQTVGLQDRGHHYPAQLSGGEQQRVAIARAFITRPPLLLADEPTGNLDSTTGARIIELLQQMKTEQGGTLVLVTHDAEIARMADRVVHLRDGRVVEDTAHPGSPSAAEAPGGSSPVRSAGAAG